MLARLATPESLHYQGVKEYFSLVLIDVEMYEVRCRFNSLFQCCQQPGADYRALTVIYGNIRT